MKALARYRMALGDVLVYRLEADVDAMEPAGPWGGKAVFDSIHRVTAAHGDGTWTVAVERQAIQVDEAVAMRMPLAGQTEFLMSPSGPVIPRGAKSPPVRFPRFPQWPVSVGQTWPAQDITAGVALSIEYTVDSIDGSCLVLNSIGHGTGTSTRASHRFDMNRGLLVHATVYVEMELADGASVRMTMVSRLRD